MSEMIFTWNKSSQEEKTPSSLVTPEHHGEEEGGKVRLKVHEWKWTSFVRCRLACFCETAKHLDAPRTGSKA